MRVHTTCNVCIRNTSRMWTCHTQHWIDITLNCPSEQNGLTNNWQYFCITTQYSKYNQSQLYFILLENFNYIIWQEYIIIKNLKKYAQLHFFWITLLALFWTLLVWKHHPSVTMAVKHPIWTIVSTWKKWQITKPVQLFPLSMNS